MYDAATEDNWVAAEKLLRGDPSLACRQQITETGDRALHVAISKKHTEMVLKLIELVDPSDLELQDGHGYTACCYAAMMGLLDVAKRILRKNPNLWNSPNKHATTPLQLAVFYGNAEVAMHFLESSRGDGNLLRKEWLFDLLLDSVRSKMYGKIYRLSSLTSSITSGFNRILSRWVFTLSD